MVLKRIIRQYLNQHFPENIKPTQKLDRKAKKIIKNQNYFRYIPLLRRIEKAQSYLKNSQIYPINEKINELKYKYTQDKLKTQYDPFFKYIEQCSTLITHVDERKIHYKTELYKDYYIENLTSDLNKNLISSNQWTGIDINCLRLPSKFYKLKKATYCLYSLSQYKVAFARKYDRRDPSSIYKSQLMERKKLGLLYGNLSKKEIYRTIQRAKKYRGVLRENVLRILESRLDVILYRIGFFKSIPSGRQWIIHRKILVNQQVVTIAHYQLKPGDVISVDRGQSDILKESIRRHFDEKPFLKYNQRRPGSLWPFVVNRRVLKKLIKFATLNDLKKHIFRATKKILHSHSNRFGLSPNWQRLRSYKKFLQRQRSRFHYLRWVSSPSTCLARKWKVELKDRQRYDPILSKEKRFRYNKQKLYTKKNSLRSAPIKYFQRKAPCIFFQRKKQSSKLIQGRKRLEFCFETIKQLKILKTITSLTQKECSIKIKDPLFTYKFLILLSRQASFTRFAKRSLLGETRIPFFCRYATKLQPFVGRKKPLYLEISYKTLTAIYLYSPQKLFFPVNLDIDGVIKSYY